MACGNRWILAARIGSSGVSEQVLADSLINELRPDTINLADRGFFSMDRWIRAAATGAHLLWRVKNVARSLPARLEKTLPDASTWVMLHESDQMLARRRKTCDNKSLSRLQPVLARLVGFTVTSPDCSGRSRPAGTGCSPPCSTTAATGRPDRRALRATLADRTDLRPVEGHAPRTRHPAERCQQTRGHQRSGPTETLTGSGQGGGDLPLQPAAAQIEPASRSCIGSVTPEIRSTGTKPLVWPPHENVRLGAGARHGRQTACVLRPT